MAQPTSKRATDNITKTNSVIKYVCIAISRIHLLSGRISHDTNFSTNKIMSAVRVISPKRVTNAIIKNNDISQLGDNEASENASIGACGKHYEGIGSDGVQGNIQILDTRIMVVEGNRVNSTPTYGIVTRSFDNRPTTAYQARNNPFAALNQNTLKLQ